MRIAVIGAGMAGGSVGRALARAGHDVTFGVRDPGDSRHDSLKIGTVRVSTVAGAAAAGDAIFLAVPWAAVPDVLDECGDLAGRILVDMTNPMAGTDLELVVGHTTSGAEVVARLASGAHVFKTLNHVGFPVIADTTGYPQPPITFVAGDDAQGKAAVLRLVEDLGFDGIDAGPLTNSRLLEPYALLWVDQAVNRGAPFDNAFAFMRKAR